MEVLQQFIQDLSNPVIAVCAIYIAKSISELNTKIAVIVERVDSHEKRISRIEEIA